MAEPSRGTVGQLVAPPEEAHVRILSRWLARVSGAAAYPRLGVLGLVLLAIIVAFCFLGPLVFHTDQVHTNLRVASLPPALGPHPLGTDDFGYDELGRLMLGGQSALELGLAAAMLAVVFGALWGAVAGYIGGPVDAVMMRVVDAMIAIPWIFFLLFLASITTLNSITLILLIAVVAWLSPARLIRAESLILRTREYVQAVRLMGGGTGRIVLRHIIPNAIGTTVVNATFQVGDAILTVATLSYLGLGPPPPAANWGSMLSRGVEFVQDGYWWMILPPGIAIIVVVVAVNFIGEGLREAISGRAPVR